METKSFFVESDYQHIKPTHVCKVLNSDYNDNPAKITFHVIGKEMPCVKHDELSGYKVLGEDGRYRYHCANEIEITGTFKVLDLIKEGE